jgi:hypothetical protein
MDSSNLRNKVYSLKDELEIAKVALDDIARIDDINLSKEIAKRTLEKLS